MPGVAPLAHGRRQVRRADKHPVDPVHRENLIQVAQAFEVLDLHQQAHLLVRLIQVAGDAVPARRPGQGAAYATNPQWRIAHGAHQLACLLGAFHHGDQQGLGADVQQLLDQRGIANGRADNALGWVRGNGLQLRQQAAQIVGRVFAVQQQPVETGVGRQLGTVAVRQAQPQANLRFALLQALLEQVQWHVHGSLLRRNGRQCCPTDRSPRGIHLRDGRPPGE